MVVNLSGSIGYLRTPDEMITPKPTPSNPSINSKDPETSLETKIYGKFAKSFSRPPVPFHTDTSYVQGWWVSTREINAPFHPIYVVFDSLTRWIAVYLL